MNAPRLSTIVFPSLIAMVALAGQAGPPVRALSLPDAIGGDRYEVSLGSPLRGRCYLADTVWQVVGGDPPQGIVGGVAGVQGLPKQVGLYEFVMEASNACEKVAVPVRLRVRNRPILVVSRDSIAIEARVGSPSAQTVSFLVGSDWPEMAFTVLPKSETAWLEVTPRNAAIPAQGSAVSAVPVSVQLKTAGMNAGVYHGEIRVAGWRADAVVIPITITVRD